MSKLFSVAGVSKRNGTFKARFANDMTRVKVLAKTGSTDIDLIELKEPMTKEAIVAYLLKINFDNGNAEVRAALEAEVENRSDKPARAVTKTAAKAKAPAKKSKPSLDAIAARAKAAPKSTKTKAQVEAELASLEDAPF